MHSRKPTNLFVGDVSKRLQLCHYGAFRQVSSLAQIFWYW